MLAARVGAARTVSMKPAGRRFAFVRHPRHHIVGIVARDDARHPITDQQHQIQHRRHHPNRELHAAPKPGVWGRTGHARQSTHESDARPTATIAHMEGSGFGGMFGDPDELQRRLGEFAEQMQGAQRLAWADNAIKLAVDLTVAAMNRANIQGTTEQQAEQLRSVMATVFPEAVTLVREAREGLQ